MDLTTAGWILAGLVALLSGLSKTGLSGVGILGVVLLAVVVPSARASVGMLLPMLIVADLFAIFIYRRHGSWHHLVRLFPWVAVGLAAGLVALWKIKRDAVFTPILGGIVLFMLAVHVARTWALRRNGGSAAKDETSLLMRIPHTWWFTVAAGLLAGFATGMSNAAGPVMTVYILAHAMDKQRFMGTTAWFFFIVNATKAPAMAAMGLIAPGTLMFNLKLAPLVILGALLGPSLLKVIPQKSFEVMVLILAAAGAVKMVSGM